jgi:hypothetical protein
LTAELETRPTRAVEPAAKRTEGLGLHLLGPVEQGLLRRDAAGAAAALARARRELPRYGGDLAAQEALELQLRYLAWEVELAFEPAPGWRAQTAAALADLAKPQYTASGQMTQIRLQLQLSLAAHCRGVRRLTAREFHLLFSCLPQDRLDRPVLEWMARWARQCGEADLGELAARLLTAP